MMRRGVAGSGDGSTARGGRLTRREFARAACGVGLSTVGLALLGGCSGTPASSPTAASKSAAAPAASPAVVPTPAPVAGPHIGFLWQGAPGPSAFADAFEQGLLEHGRVVGGNINLEQRYASGRLEQLANQAAELVGMKVDVIVTSGTQAALTAKKATTGIPIVMALSTDPIENGLITTLSQPGGNVTGLTNTAREHAGKRLELLKSVVPTLSRAGVLWNASSSDDARSVDELREAAQKFGLQAEPIEVKAPTPDVGAALDSAASRGIQGIVVVNDAAIFARARALADAATKNKLPTIFDRREYLPSGGLMAYGANLADLHRRAAGYVDKILKGAKPADLPVEPPAKLDFAINLKTAQALGLTIPAPVLAQATERLE